MERKKIYTRILYLIIPLQIILFLLIVIFSQSIRNIPGLAFNFIAILLYIVSPVLLSIICVVQGILFAKWSQTKHFSRIYFILEFLKLFFSLFTYLHMMVYILFLPFFLIYWQNTFLFNTPVFQRNKYAQKSMDSPFLYARILH